MNIGMSVYNMVQRPGRFQQMVRSDDSSEGKTLKLTADFK